MMKPKDDDDIEGVNDHKIDSYTLAGASPCAESDTSYKLHNIYKIIWN